MTELTQLQGLGDLGAMEQDVYDWCVAKGWYDQSRTGDESSFSAHMALLHSEVGEMTDAYRRWGLGDATDLYDELLGAKTLPKPEGVGSEAADVLIRMLDDSRRHGLDLPGRLPVQHGRFGLREYFIDNMETVHVLIARVSMAHSDEFTWPGEDTEGDHFARVLVFLLQVCDKYGIDLQAEYTRKMAFNWTRAYRHGDKRL
jgi:NTP pyrophosphatase (non-canonical NTP hydrolase)